MNGRKVNLINKLHIISSVLKHKLFNKRVPLIVSWTLTNRCNHKCAYCDLPNRVTEELSTEEILSIISQLKKNKTQRIGFTGGEPLLREDIGEIIDFCKENTIFTGIVTNGSLVKKMIKDIANLDLLQLSIDGNEETNDSQRYKGSYKDVISSINVARDNNLRVWLTYVITKNNTDQENYEHVLKIANEFSLKVFFQPVVDYENCGLDSGALFPKNEDYKIMIENIIEIKKARNNTIGNSLVGLKELYNWPVLRKTNCYAGKLMAHIYPNGEVFPCFNLIYHKASNAKNGFMEAFSAPTDRVDNCPGCWTYATIEFNYLLSLNSNSILNTIRLLRK